MYAETGMSSLKLMVCLETKWCIFYSKSWPLTTMLTRAHNIVTELFLQAALAILMQQWFNYNETNKVRSSIIQSFQQGVIVTILGLIELGSW